MFYQNFDLIFTSMQEIEEGLKLSNDREKKG